MKALNITGKIYGRLIVIERIGSKDGRALWKCRCRCGKETQILARSLTSGNAKSCGKCNDNILYPDLYSTWVTMHQRCYNKNAANYKYYGARGIRVCSRWKIDFLNFVDDMGSRPKNTTLDRIDVNKDYSPENCRWADHITQQNNRTNTYVNRYQTTIAILQQQASTAHLPAQIPTLSSEL